ncbi:jg22673 [Pararge aegeria aegeria]|uniref:Jg22673 protein n=1 Tax=Pararge aegeria aegeria TaxID=348720 RepID=A0A8S4QCK7_9NEOP|nr:jg22673 [Pararge aegeria aegeria]
MSQHPFQAGSYYGPLQKSCVEPLRLGSWPKTDLAQFLCAYEQCALQMDVLREADLKLVWERYMRVVSQCLLTMYQI